MHIANTDNATNPNYKNTLYVRHMPQILMILWDTKEW